MSGRGQYTLMSVFTHPSYGDVNTLIYLHFQFESFLLLINICSMSRCDVLYDAETIINSSF